MKYLAIVALFVCAIVALSAGDDGCPSGEYYPGPDCRLEPSCAPRSSHFIPKHTCDCWCKPGTYRNTDTNTCVELEGCV